MSNHSLDTPTDSFPKAEKPHRPLIPRLVRTLAIPVILAWIAIVVVLSTIVPSLDEVGKMRSVSMSPHDAPSMIAMKQVGSDFKEFDSDSSAMVVLESDHPLDAAAHAYYDQIVAKLQADTAHVEHVQDFWSDPLTASGSQSADGKSSYVQVYLRGNQGETLANESVEAVSNTLKSVPAPPGLKSYVTGAAAQASDMNVAGDRSLKVMEAVSFAVIIVMLLLVYRSVVTVLIELFIVMVLVGAARGLVAVLGFYKVIGMSTFATNLLPMLAIAAATDYAIFLIGRYQEARTAGMSKEDAYYDMYHGTAHVILGSGLTIAGATYCLHFTRLPYFQTLGIPLAIGMVTVVLAALSLGPALISIVTKFGKTLEPKRVMRVRGWRKIGAAITRWPGPILVATIAVALVGLVAIPGYKTSYDDRQYMPADLTSNEGYSAANRHFSPARMNPDLLLVQSDHDLRNPSDFLVINKIAKAVVAVPGIAQVQAITRPQGTPIEHSTIPFQLGMQSTTQVMNQKYQQDMMRDMLKQVDDIQVSIDTMTKMQSITVQMSEVMDSMVGKMHGMLGDIEDLRNHISDFDDFFRPIRNYLYWEPHCYDIPMCWSMRSVFDTLDGIDTMTDDFQTIIPDMDKMSGLTKQMVQVMPPQIETMKHMKKYMQMMYATQNGQQEQQAEGSKNSSAMGEAFDKSKNDDSFYLPPEAFDSADFKRGMKNFISPDGKSVRFIVQHEGNPLTPEGISHIDAIKQAAKEAIKGTPLEGSKIYLAGSAATFRDMAEGSNYDLMIAGISALALIFVIMLIITRAVVAAAVIVATVAISLGASLGMSILIWQYLIGLPLHWMVIPMSVIILLAVGADYNLLLVARFKEEIHAGLHTGIIRAMGSTGSVVTNAGLVFAFTMASMMVSELRIIGQVGTTIGLGLLFDTLVIRSFMMPSIAALMGKWFWWPQIVRQRPVPSRWPSPEKVDANV
ncbi:MMPL family transporter [Mycobacterium sp. CBMA293]|uniref:MMPL/RND family transporter n=1 Tax=unclassified Mycolicibacterium TaxID=2636767 RepID=UPI0012DDC0ED|nr:MULTISPECIES: MMPL family transporter [unclassified Mycolicibacterium]MUL47880.1 MMPL family transporter [Mycolicibacterium sp. CBMA 360]MUL59272.1 MMPL family transporter [Mycolicibacterium sp. CBMA 335]MUL70997.1 MMPL family transporter [Mycolicibacterium sp. CBMA 311]MUL94640.1 MMPL family transporter [Mycolicibacterium sp. CBMA 230]MUM09182.1 MMPL family RND transporter [Mycolicibacterium sp. CBMA 213]